MPALATAAAFHKHEELFSSPPEVAGYKSRILQTAVTLHLFMFPGTHSVSYHVYLVAGTLGLAIFDLTFLQAEQ